MAHIDTTGWKPERIGRLNKLLDKLIRSEGQVKTQRQWIEDMPDDVTKEVIDGMIDYNRTHFNRLTSDRAQREYIARLKEKRNYVVGDMLVPKLVFDAVPGEIIADVDRKGAA